MEQQNNTPNTPNTPNTTANTPLARYPDITYEMVFNVYSAGIEIRKNPRYLDNAPYSEAVKKSLKLIFPPITVNLCDKNAENSDSDLMNLDLETEIKSLYFETKSLLNSNALDDKDKASVQRTATTQLEKLLTMIEKSINIRHMREFETKVLKVLKKVAPETREQFLEELARLEQTETTGANQSEVGE